MSCNIKHFKVLVVALITLFGQPVLAQNTISPSVEPDELDQLEEALRPFVMPESGPFRPDQISIEQMAIISAWSRSGHANIASRSFSNWNDAGEIPPVCATCHSGAGFRALHGLDGSQPGLPDHPMPTGGVVDCDTCHNPRLSSVEEIRFPSGLMHPVAPGEASCLTCHQGRAAGNMITNAVADKAEDLPDPDLGFINPHYAVAASTWLGGYAASGYHYPGKPYSGRFFHARPVASCASCHDPHTLTVSEQTCLTCHQESQPQDIRLSRQSFDGSGNLTQGIRADIAANADLLKGMLSDYAAQIAGTPMVYDGHRHPYFFADANGDGIMDEAEGKPAPYNAWTPRLLKAAYNWKFVTADPGAYAHNPHYALELLYDTIEDLGNPLGFDMAAAGLAR